MPFWDGTRWIDEPASSQHRSIAGAARSGRARLTDAIATAVLVIGLVALFVPFTGALAQGSSIGISPSSGSAGTTVRVAGTAFSPRGRIQITWDGNPSGMPRLVVDRSGRFTTTIVIPLAPTGSHAIGAAPITKSKNAALLESAPAGSAAVMFTLTLPGDDLAPTEPPVASFAATPAPTDAASADPTLAPTLVPTPAPTLGPPATAQPTPVVTSPPQPTASVTNTPNPTPTRTPTPTATPDPTPRPTPTPQPTAPPTPGWDAIFRDDFQTPLSEGQFPNAKWNAYPYGWMDSPKNGNYDPSIVSVHDGMMDIHIRTTNGIHRVACLAPKFAGSNWGAQLYGRYEIRAKADSMHGYKAAWLLWPETEVWPRDGEIDFPEGGFDGNISAFMHRQGGTSGGDQDAYSTNEVWTTWHTYVTEWTPAYVKFYIDGTLIGKSTSRIPNTRMGLRIQNETTDAGFEPADSVSGHILIDYVAVWAYTP
jgi:beta-glucanase (GH16 family)